MGCVSIVRVSGYGIDIPAPVPPIAELRSTIMQFRRGAREIASLARAGPFHAQKGPCLGLTSFCTLIMPIMADRQDFRFIVKVDRTLRKRFLFPKENERETEY